MKRLSAALGLSALLVCTGASADVCLVTAPQACVNEYTIYDTPGAIKLTSDIKYFGPVVKIRYMVTTGPADALYTIHWKATDGSTLIESENHLGWFNSNWYSVSVEWEGMLLPTPDVILLTGTADFSGSTPIPDSCPKGICDAKYYEWTANVPAAPTFKAGSTTTQLPPGFEGATQTRTVLQRVVASPTDPDNIDAATYTDLYRFASRVEVVGGGYRYVHSFENLSGVEVSYSLPELGLVGTAAAGSTASAQQLSDLGPGVLRTTPRIERNASSAAAARFDALVPMQAVPEPSTSASLLGGLGMVLLALRRLHSRLG